MVQSISNKRYQGKIDRIWKLYTYGNVAWIQGNFALDAHGMDEDIRANTVRGCCLVGAIHRIYGRWAQPLHGQKNTRVAVVVEPECVIDRIARHIGMRDIWQWNDQKERVYADIIRMCKTLDL